MHDNVNLESRGIPTVSIATVQFQSAAAAQGKILGFNPAMLFVEHPIQDRTDEELIQIAQNTFEQIVLALTSQEVP